VVLRDRRLSQQPGSRVILFGERPETIKNSGQGEGPGQESAVVHVVPLLAF